jgi:hypothetical protein
MEKVRLIVDELQVQSFATTDEEAERRGTVRAHDAPTDPVGCPTADPAWDTCWGSCGGTCDYSCDRCEATGPGCGNGFTTGFFASYC